MNVSQTLFPFFLVELFMATESVLKLHVIDEERLLD
jgi:hypothetical protein